MIHYEPWQWVTYFATNWLTALAYFAIPLGLHLEQLRGKCARSDIVLYEMFIVACGLHHLIHPPAMYFGYFYPIMIMDSFTAGISVLSAWMIIKTMAGDRG